MVINTTVIVIIATDVVILIIVLESLGIFVEFNRFLRVSKMQKWFEEWLSYVMYIYIYIQYLIVSVYFWNEI